MPSFVHLDHRIEYQTFGQGDRTTVLLHGLLLSQRMHKPLARALAERGNRVVTIDLLGHGRSDRPPNMWEYSMSMFGEQVIALLDHLELDQAVVAGTSLGANVTLEAAALAPERLRGMVIEMPVLDGAMIACGVAFLPLLLAMRYGGPLMRGVQLAANAVPRGAPPFLIDVGLDTIRQDPRPSGAVLEGLFFGRIAPHRWQRRTFTQPSLVIGHRRDPVHPFSDAGMLADELPNGRLLEASSILELRLAPERLTNEIADFIQECWEAEAPAPPRAAGRRAAAR
ncbi:MAG TPA: alpha/beta hydrolase [Solirubrobacteraceae bacterium]